MHIVEERPDIVNENGEIVRQRPRIRKVFEGPSLTRQEFKDECDLELTLKKFALMPEGRELLENIAGYAVNSRFDDVSAVPDFRAARDIVIASEAKFMALPAIVRRRFDNDPAALLDFVQNPANYDEAVKLGLCEPKVSPGEAKGT